jgi:ABC-type lipoprotein export system ATPase subunit
MKNVKLCACAITKSFMQASLNVDVLKGVSVCFEHGKTYAITGVSGAGKSTLLHILAGLEEPSKGEITFNGRTLFSMSAAEHTHFLNKSIGLVFQSPYLIAELSVVENVMVKGMIMGEQYDECRVKALALLNTVGLQDKAESKPSTLSGGQQQRVAVIRALFNEPVFLLADEPTGNLDEKTGKDLIDFILDCQKQWHMGVIISSHDAYVTSMMSTVFELHDGMLLKELKKELRSKDLDINM